MWDAPMLCSSDTKFNIQVPCIYAVQLPKVARVHLMLKSVWHLFFNDCYFSTRTVGEEIGHDTFVVGSLERVWETWSLLSEKEREVVGAVSKMWVFKRAIVIGVEYQSFLYKRTTSRNNCTIIFQRHGKSHYGSIEKFVKCLEKCSRMQCLHEKCSCSLSVRYIALVRKLSRHPCQFPVYHGMQVVKHILRVTITDRVLAVPISYIKEKCMRIDVDPTRVYVCHTPNSFEKD